MNPLRDIWMVLWNKTVEEDSTVSFISEIFDHKPTLSEIKNTVLGWYNSQIDQKIVSGFTWNDTPVWLSMENQFNYKAAYDLAIQSEGALLPTFKIGTSEEPIYHTFSSVDELKDFYTSSVAYVTDTLAEGWAIKDSIDWSVYEELLES